MQLFTPLTVAINQRPVEQRTDKYKAIHGTNVSASRVQSHDLLTVRMCIQIRIRGHHEIHKC